MTGFSTFGFSEAMINKLTAINFTTPTPIQEQSIPIAMAGKDILGTAQTGTGKTAAFGLPLVHHLINKPHSMALIMTPTRELAVQVMTQVKAFLPDGCGIKTALLIGGEAMFKQLNQLQTKPRIIIGTPGRIYDHLDRDSLRLAKADFLVLDEADRMLDMGFGVQLEAIAKFLPETRQTLMFSATVPPNIMKLAQNYLKDPARVETHVAHQAAPKIKQELIHVNDDNKHDQLVSLLTARSGQIIVFVKTKHGADRLARKLIRENHLADAIHGDLRQGQRDRVIRQFRKNETRILVATDVAARGLDIPMLETVINYDLPQCPEDYIHRIGRTGRNGEEGEAICLITNADKSKWGAIDRLMNPGKAKAEGGFERSGGRSGGRGGSSRGGPRKFGGSSRDGGERSGERNYGPKSSFGERKYGDKPAGEKRFGKPFGARAEGRSSEGRSFEGRDDRSPRAHHAEHPHAVKHSAPRGAERGERMDSNYDPVVQQAKSEFDSRKSGERNFSKPRSDKPFGEKKFGERKFGDKPFGEKKFGERKFGDKPFGEKKFGDRKPSDKPFGEKKFGDRKSSDKPFGEKKFGERKFGDKPFGEKKFGSKPFGEKKFGDKPAPRKPRPAA